LLIKYLLTYYVCSHFKFLPSSSRNLKGLYTCCESMMCHVWTCGACAFLRLPLVIRCRLSQISSGQTTRDRCESRELDFFLCVLVEATTILVALFDSSAHTPSSTGLSGTPSRPYHSHHVPGSTGMRNVVRRFLILFGMMSIQFQHVSN
jgi:hypothetical protein